QRRDDARSTLSPAWPVSSRDHRSCAPPVLRARSSSEYVEPTVPPASLVRDRLAPELSARLCLAREFPRVGECAVLYQCIRAFYAPGQHGACGQKSNWPAGGLRSPAKSSPVVEVYVRSRGRLRMR